jgi:CheY-like chemotaxis protein
MEAKQSVWSVPRVTRPAAPARSRRILIVDDERPLRDIVAETLRDAGYQVDTAHNGADALIRIRHRRPDAIVLDLMMPVMDATAFVGLLRMNPKVADLPIVVISAAYRADDEAERLGAYACLSKPFQLEELVAAVEGALSSRGLKPSPDRL